MKAMILCAGLGNRMLPLTKHTPKPLLKVAGEPLVVWHIKRLVDAGFKEVIINIAHLGWKIQEYLGDGSHYGISIIYSDEQKEGALETAGGIIKALPLLGDSQFLIINGDIWCDYPYNSNFQFKETSAHLILVPNPPQHPKGDFTLENGNDYYTFSGIAYYSPQFFDNLPYGKQSLAPLLKEGIATNTISREVYKGEWRDIGTPQRLEQLNRDLDS